MTLRSRRLGATMAAAWLACGIAPALAVPPQVSPPNTDISTFNRGILKYGLMPPVLAHGDVYGIFGTKARSLNDHFYDHLSVRDFGAVCDGNIDDTAALNKAFATGFYIELPPQTCAFTGPLLMGNPYSQVHGSGMYGASTLLYRGTSRTANLLTIGSLTPPTNVSGLTSQGYQAIGGFLIQSAVKMTGGSAVVSAGTQFIRFKDISLGRQQDPSNLWNGFTFAQEDRQELDGYFITVQNEAIQAYGFGAEPGAGANGGASGPQYEVWIDHGKIGGAHIALHVGGGIDGVYLDHSMITNNDYDLVVDTALSPHPNQEIVLGSQAFLDFARWDTVLIDDPKCVPGIMCEVSISGPLLHAGNPGGSNAGVGSGSFAGRPAPANSGNLIHIKSYPRGVVAFDSPYAIDYRNAGVYDEDQAAVLVANPGMHMGSAAPIGSGLSPKGIVATATWSGVKRLPTFVNVATPLVNVITPDLTTPTGALKVGLGTAVDDFGQAVVSNNGAETYELACGTPFKVASNACRELFINRSTNSYVDHTIDAASQHLAVGGQDRVVVTGATTQLRNNLRTLPASPPDDGRCSFGQLSVDASYIYVCTAANTWKRSALTAY